MFKLTRQEQRILTVIIGLLLVGWAVRAWRLAHPVVPAAAGSASETYATD